MKMDKLYIKQEADGKLCVMTAEISEENHIDADDLLDFINEHMGGEVVQERNKQAAEVWWKNRQVLRGGKIVKVGNGD